MFQTYSFTSLRERQEIAAWQKLHSVKCPYCGGGQFEPLKDGRIQDYEPTRNTKIDLAFAVCTNCTAMVVFDYERLRAMVSPGIEEEQRIESERLTARQQQLEAQRIEREAQEVEER